LVVVVVFVLGGPLNEELGWRGFALPALQRQLRPLTASLVLGILWAVWHLPLFWITGASQAGTPPGWILLQIVCLSVLFTWLYNGTDGSLFLALVFHTALNSTGAVLPLLPAATGSTQAIRFTVAVTVIAAVLVAVVPSGLRHQEPAIGLTD
jgi:hypothetical protein